MSDIATLSVEWRSALDAAQDAIDAASLNSRAVGFDGDELGVRARALVRERADTELILEQLAGVEHTHLDRRVVGPRARPELIGLDPDVQACIFDLDGVLTASDELHAAAWQETFDELLVGMHDWLGPWRPFDVHRDYEQLIRGRPRIAGVRAFLGERGIHLPDGSPADPPGLTSVHALAERKNELLRRKLDVDGVRAFEGSVRFLELAGEARLRCCVVSPSANTRAILRSAGLLGLVDEIFDGDDLWSEHLLGKPSPDSLLALSARIGVATAHVASFETTLDGVIASVAAGVHDIVAVHRWGQAAAFAAAGAVRVVADLGALIDPVLA